MPFYLACRTCDGTGISRHEDVCPSCEGEGGFCVHTDAGGTGISVRLVPGDCEDSLDEGETGDLD